jgi:thiamine biosynthesis lipoprotein
MTRLIQAFFSIFVLSILFACTEPTVAQSTLVDEVVDVALEGKTMGTTYHIKVVAKPSDIEKSQLKQKIDALLIEVNQQMSTYIPTSELSLFNQSTATEAVEISEGLRRVIAESMRLGEMSDGLLDITVGPLVNLWGFGPTHRPDKIPSDEELTEARARIGLDKLVLNGNKLQKTIPNLYVDLSTTAKGYGVDVVAELIESEGFHQYLVEIGGEMRVKGVKANNKDWRVAIEKPVSQERAVQQIIVPKDHAIATSGDYRIYFEENGQRFSHIINPKTGKPINHKLVSVSVIDESCMTADGLATMLMVMGTEKALAFAEKHNLAVLTVTKTNDGFKQQSTVKFNQFIAQ